MIKRPNPIKRHSSVPPDQAVQTYYRNHQPKVVRAPDAENDEFSWDDFLEDMVMAGYEGEKNKALAAGAMEFTWDDYVINQFLDMIKKIKEPDGREEAVQKFLKSNQLTDKEKFKLIYSNLDKI